MSEDPRSARVPTGAAGTSAETAEGTPATAGSAGPRLAGRAAPRHVYEVLDSRTVFRGHVVDVRTDEVLMPGGRVEERDVVVHPGAVGVVVLDDAERVALLEQYRHPVARRLLELPAGLLDVRGEPAAHAAARELAEEAGLRASQWSVLVDALTSPGMTDESIRIYLARGVSEIPDAQRPVRLDEESELAVRWVPLATAVEEVFAGRICNGMAVMGLLAATVALGRSAEPRELPPATP